MRKSKFEKACALMGLALIEIREVALADKNGVAYHLADLFHSLPACIAKNFDGDPDRVYDELMEVAHQRGLSKWIENASAQLFRE